MGPGHGKRMCSYSAPPRPTLDIFRDIQSPANDSLVQVLTMAGPAPRQTKYVQYVWPYIPKSAAVLRVRGHVVIDEEPAWS